MSQYVIPVSTHKRVQDVILCLIQHMRVFDVPGLLLLVNLSNVSFLKLAPSEISCDSGFEFAPFGWIFSFRLVRALQFTNGFVHSYNFHVCHVVGNSNFIIRLLASIAFNTTISK